MTENQERTEKVTSTLQDPADSNTSNETNGYKLFKKLMQLCKEVGDTKDIEKIVQRLNKNFEECSSEYRESAKFCNLIEKKLVTIQKRPDQKFLHLKEVKDELKAKKKKNKKDGSLNDERLAKQSAPAEDSTTNGSKSDSNNKGADVNPASLPGSSSVENNSKGPPASSSKTENENSRNASSKKHENDDAKTQRLIERIEMAIAKLDWKIQQLDKQEIDFDALSDDEESAYIQKDRYEIRICKLYRQLSKLKKESATASRHTLQAIRFSGTRHTDVNRAVEQFFNKKREFPNFPDIMKTVTNVNKEKSLNFTAETIHQVAKEAFKELGTQLKKRRQYELHEHMIGYLSTSELTEMDPANNDEELEKKLAENKKLYQSKMDVVVDEYAEKQKEINEEGILEEDAELVESGKTSPEVSSQEDESDAETENGIEQEVEEVENEMNEASEGEVENDSEADKENEETNGDSKSESRVIGDDAECKPVNDVKASKMDSVPENPSPESKSNADKREVVEEQDRSEDKKCSAEEADLPKTDESEPKKEEDSSTTTASGSLTEESQDKEFHLPFLTDEDMADKDSCEMKGESVKNEDSSNVIEDLAKKGDYYKTAGKSMEDNKDSGEKMEESIAENKDSCERKEEDTEESKRLKEEIEEALCMEVEEVSESGSYDDSDEEMPQTRVAQAKSLNDSLSKEEPEIVSKEIKASPESDLKSEDSSNKEKEERGSESACDTKPKEAFAAKLGLQPNRRECLIDEDTFVIIEKHLIALCAVEKIVTEKSDNSPASIKDPSVKIVEENIFIASSSGSIFLSPKKKTTVVPTAEPSKDTEQNTCQKIMKFVELPKEPHEPSNPLMPPLVPENNSVFVVSSCGQAFVVPQKVKTVHPTKTDILGKYRYVIKPCKVEIARCDDVVAKLERRRKKRLGIIQTILLSSSSSSCESDDNAPPTKHVSTKKKRRKSSSSDSDFDPYKVTSSSSAKRKKRRASHHGPQVQLFRSTKHAGNDSDDIIVLDEVPPRKKDSEEIVVEVDTNSLLGIMNSGPSRSNVSYNVQNYPKQRGNISITPINNVQRPIRNLVPQLPVKSSPVRIPLTNARFSAPPVRHATVYIRRPNVLISGAPTRVSQPRHTANSYRQVRPSFQQVQQQRTSTVPRGGLVQQQRNFQTNARQFNGANRNVMQRQSVETYQMKHTGPQQTSTSVINNRNVQVVTKTVTQTVKTIVQQQRISQISSTPRIRPAINNFQNPRLAPQSKDRPTPPADVITID